MKTITLDKPVRLTANIPINSIIISKDIKWITWIEKRKDGNYDIRTCETKVFECQNDTETCQVTKEEIKKIAIAIGFKVE